MVEIIPFRGIRYNSKKVDMEKVVAPPYDIISEEARDGYYKRHENNVVRLILGKDLSRDTSKNNKYTRAASHFNTWLGRGVLIRDEEPSIYIYEQEYLHRGKKRIMRGFIALAKLEEFESGTILPHEETLSKPVKDRLELMRACKANLSPIFALYSEPDKIIDRFQSIETEETPLIDMEENQIRHRLWRVGSTSTIKNIIEEMEDKKVFIADGHHRYQTALRYRDERGEKTRSYTGKESYDYTMMYFTNMNSEGVTILPAHRLVRNIRESIISRIEKDLSGHFKVDVLKFNKENELGQRKRLFEQMETLNKSGHAFGMYCRGNKYYLLTLKDEKIIDNMIKVGRSKEWKRLDVTIIHALVIDHILGIKLEEDEDSIAYIIDEERAIKMVKEGKYQLALFLNPTKVEEVKNIALAGERMPGKATYFYPKLLTGLVMNKMD